MKCDSVRFVTYDGQKDRNKRVKAATLKKIDPALFTNTLEKGKKIK